jgi:hypothetical protein
MITNPKKINEFYGSLPEDKLDAIKKGIKNNFNRYIHF